MGSLLREKRRRLDQTLEEVARRAGITKGFLSGIERDKAAPSVATLMRLRDILSLPIASLFRSSLPEVVHAADREPIAFGGVGITYSLLSAGTAHRVAVVRGELEGRACSGKELHTLTADEEIIVVISGSLDVTVDTETHRLRAGDSFTFDPRRPHRYENPSRDKRTLAICIIAPPPK